MPAAPGGRTTSRRISGTASGYCGNSGVHRRRRPVARARHRSELRDLLARERPPAPHPAGRQAFTTRAASITARGPTRSGSRCATGTGPSPQQATAWGTERFDLAHGGAVGIRRGSLRERRLLRHPRRAARCWAERSRRPTTGAAAGPTVRSRSSATGAGSPGSAARADVDRPAALAQPRPVHDHRRHAAGLPRARSSVARSTSPCRSARSIRS